MDKTSMDDLYSQRASVVAALARMAIMAGFKAGVGLDDKEANDIEWRRVLYVDTPAGQVSWHIAPCDQHLLEGIPAYAGKWDGTYKSRDGSFAIWDISAVDYIVATVNIDGGWVNITGKQQRVLTMYKNCHVGYGYTFKAIAENCEITMDEVAPIVRSLAALQVLVFQKGCSTEEGEFVGSIYTLTDHGKALVTGLFQ